MAYFAPVQNYRSNFGNAIAQGMGQVASGMQRGQDLAEQERVRQEEIARQERHRTEDINRDEHWRRKGATLQHGVLYEDPSQEVQRTTLAPQAPAPFDPNSPILQSWQSPTLTPQTGINVGGTQYAPQTTTERVLPEGVSRIGEAMWIDPRLSAAGRAADLETRLQEERATASQERIARMLEADPTASLPETRAILAAWNISPEAVFGSITPQQRREEGVLDFTSQTPGYIERHRQRAGIDFGHNMALQNARERAAAARSGGSGGAGGNRPMTGGQDFQAMRESISGDIRHLHYSGIPRDAAMEWMVSNYGERLGFPGVIRGLVADHYAVGDNGITWDQAMERATKSIAASNMATHPVTGRKVSVGSLTPEERRLARDIEAQEEFGGEPPSARALRRMEEAEAEEAARQQGGGPQQTPEESFQYLRETMANPTRAFEVPTTAFGNPFHGRGREQAPAAQPQRPASSNYFSGRSPATVVSDSSKIIRESAALPPATRLPLLHDVLAGLREVQGDMTPRTRQHIQIGRSIREVENAIEAASR